MTRKMVFIGSSQFAAQLLRGMIAQGGGLALTAGMAGPSADVPDWADLTVTAAAGDVKHIAVKTLSDKSVVSEIRKAKPQTIIVADEALAVPAGLLRLAKVGLIGVHPSLLPRHRGEHAIPSQILEGATEGGVTFYRMAEGLDAGPVIAQRRFRISLTDTARTVYDRAASTASDMLAEILEMLSRGKLDETPQDPRYVTRSQRLGPGKGRIDWRRNSRRLFDMVRAFTDPYWGAFCYLGAKKLVVWDAGFSHEPIEAKPGEVVRIADRGIEVATGAGVLVLRRAQVGEEPEHALDALTHEGVQLGTILT